MRYAIIQYYGENIYECKTDNIFSIHLFMQAEMQPVPLICEECFRRSWIMLCIRIILLLKFISVGPMHTKYLSPWEKFPRRCFCHKFSTKVLIVLTRIHTFSPKTKLSWNPIRIWLHKFLRWLRSPLCHKCIYKYKFVFCLHTYHQ